MAEYLPVLRRSFADLRDNKALLVPFLLESAGITLLFLLLAAVYLAIFFPAMGFGLEDFASQEAIVAAFKAVPWSADLIASLIGGALVAALLLVATTAYFTAGSLALVNEVVEGRRVSAQAFFAAARDRTGALFGYYLLSGLLFLVAAAPMGICIALAVMQEGARVAFVLLAVLFGFLFLAAAIALTFALLFAQPLLVRERAGPASAVRRSFALLRDKTGLVLATGLIVVCIGVAVSLVAGIATLPLSLPAQLRPENLGFAALDLVATLVKNLVSLVTSVVLSLFLFRVYKEESASQAPTRVQKSELFPRRP